MGAMPGLLLVAALLSAERIDHLPAAERAAWQAYVETSRRQEALDRETLAAEVKASGRTRWEPAPPGPAFEAAKDVDIRRLGDIVASFQTPTGGWSKNLDFRRPRAAGEGYTADDSWAWVGTFDNGATIGPLRVLAEAYATHGDARHAAAFQRGLAYLLLAQFPSGGWPQVYPLQGGYHDAATFNDDATAGVLAVLSDVAQGRLGPADAALRARAAEALARGHDFALRAQVVVAGRRTVWCAQHDPLDLEPVGARIYEPAALSGLESAGLLDRLMEADPEGANPRIVEAVESAAAWFDRTAIRGHRYTEERELVEDATAGPLWARFYEIGTNRPLFSDRRGLILYDWREVSEERRRGYAWYTDRPAATLRRYEAWMARRPRRPR